MTLPDCMTPDHITPDHLLGPCQGYQALLLENTRLQKEATARAATAERLLMALRQIRQVCDDNAAAGDSQMALAFVSRIVKGTVHNKL